jgi:glutaredoxin-like protein NrdH|tara:strand:+ start:197 stop:496 length:300 start_codon:yes stop_codon:yes gene_type:complete
MRCVFKKGRAQDVRYPKNAAMKRGFAMEIQIYSKPACVQCTATYRALDKQGLDYKVIDITAESGAQEEVEALGYRQLPVVVVGEDHWSGFRPDRIQALA